MQERLIKLRSIIYAEENLVGEFQTEALRSKMEAESQVDLSDQVQSCPSGPFEQFCEEMEPKLKGYLWKTVFVAQISILHLRNIEEQKKKPEEKRFPSSTSLVDESRIFGRDSEREKIIVDLGTYRGKVIATRASQQEENCSTYRRWISCHYHCQFAWGWEDSPCTAGVQ
ncbi:hypothetical protein Nepgr_022461 [Nepenthes gracilis]|uniref:Uncharacterized protein n=1 Tax=Nepenthes gracilis TaxID=150966 RepID=A0AAD3T0U2_NEPGR|nr:hypothetical protein Nepgr_022461 [Nepenthes gracilis]